jgi:hypothetical protein
LPSFKETIKHASAALNDEQNITVYQSIQRPVAALVEIRNHLTDEAEDQQRIMLEQRLSLLEYIDSIDYQHYRSTQPEQRQREIHNRRQAHVPVHLVLPNLSLSTVLLFLAIPVVCMSYIYFNIKPRAQIDRPVWPAGLLDLQNSTAQFAWMDASSTKMMSFEGVGFPFASNSSLQINAARSAANHEEIMIGIHQAMNRMHQLLQSKSTLFIECYVYIWAFLVEHGRNTVLGATIGGRFTLDADEQLEIRALEALRLGMEQLFKHTYKSAEELSCLRGNTIDAQTIVLEKMINEERRSNTSLYKERNQLLYDWYKILDEHKIPHWPLGDKTIKPSSSRVMQAAMADTMCPWWQAPLKYIMNTAGGIQQMLCVQWQASAHPPLKSAEKIIKTRTPKARSQLG